MSKLRDLGGQTCRVTDKVLHIYSSLPIISGQPYGQPIQSVAEEFIKFPITQVSLDIKSSVCVCNWPPVRGVCSNYEVV